MVIDFHTHVFPERVAPNALKSLSLKSGGVRPIFDGTPAGLIRRIGETGTDIAVVLNIATNANQQKAVNDFAIEINGGKFGTAPSIDGVCNPLVAFGSIYPIGQDLRDVRNELERLALAGIKGIKFHPEYQSFFVDDERMFPIYEMIAAYGIITVFHSGADIGHPKPIHCAPQGLARALPSFRGAPVVAAHLGAYVYWDDVEKYLVGRDVYFDTSYCYSRVPFVQADNIVKAHGVDRILYGSDLPWSDDFGEKELVNHFNISGAERDKIFSGNARRLLQL